MKQTASITFGTVQQGRSPKHLKMGDLLAAKNVRQTKRGSFAKRRGFSHTIPTFSGASWVGPAESLMPGDGASILARDADDRHWAYDADAATMREMGRAKRVWPTSTVKVATQILAPRPVIVEVGNNTWTFAVGASGTYYRQVCDTTSGVQILAETSQSATGILQLGAAYDGTYVWVIWVAGGTTVTAHRYTPSSPGTAPTSTTYQSGIGTTLSGCEVYRLSGISETAVVVTSLSAATTVVSHSYLDPATGAARTSPAAVTSTYAGAAGSSRLGASAILRPQTGTTTWYFATWRSGTGGGGSARLHLVAVTSSTLAIASTTTLVDTSGDSSDTRSMGVVTGYVAGNGDRVVYATWEKDMVTAVNFRPDLLVVTRYTYNGSSVTTATIGRASWLASGVVQYGSTYYLLLGFDDPVVSPATVAAFQRTLFLVDSDGKHIAVINGGESGACNHRGTTAAVDSDAGQADSHVPAAFASGTKLYFGVATVGTQTNLVLTSVVAVDMAPTFGKPAQLPGGFAIAPGNIATGWNHLQRSHELGPLCSPHYLSSGGGDATWTGIAAVYRIVDADGTVWRSAPSVVVNTSGAGATMTAPSLRHLLPGTRAQVEFYGGTSTLQLVGIVDNDSSADTVTYVVPAAPVPLGETLYTTGGALSAAPPPPCRAACQWRNRLFLAKGRDVWVSQEIVPGFGPRFNEVQITPITSGTGDILAIAPIDWNYLAVFKRDSISVLSGAGPDGRGSGNYIAQVLPVRDGVINTGSVLGETPAGVYYQSASTGRVMVIGPDLVARDVGEAFQDYDGEAITASSYDPSEQLAMFWTSGPRMLVIDVSAPTEDAPGGQGYTWESASLLQGYGACVDATGPVHIETSGALKRPANQWVDSPASAVLVTMDLGHMQPAGILGEWQACELHFLGTWVSVNDLEITVYPDFSDTGTAKRVSLAGSPAQVSTRPAGCGRVHALRVKLAEIQAIIGTEYEDPDIPVYADGEGFAFDGVRLTYTTRGHAKALNSGEVL